MQHLFPWYVIHKTTHYIVAGFNDHRDAELFAGAFSHDQYVVRDLPTVKALHATA